PPANCRAITLRLAGKGLTFQKIEPKCLFMGIVNDYFEQSEFYRTAIIKKMNLTIHKQWKRQ
ncbi:MAG: hypothetical protein IJ764_02270, partial [Bacteroidales bacterium]|nr:hypothetical protein [Bacteroidales bacterium]